MGQTRDWKPIMQYSTLCACGLLIAAAVAYRVARSEVDIVAVIATVMAAVGGGAALGHVNGKRAGKGDK